MSIEDRIALFLKKFPNKETVVKAVNLFNWHFTLTGSCEFGRKSFCKQHGIDIDKDSFTVSKFMELVENQYGSEVIRALKEKYN